MSMSMSKFMLAVVVGSVGKKNNRIIVRLTDSVWKEVSDKSLLYYTYSNGAWNKHLSYEEAVSL